jgi:hypothetical protein
MGYPVCQQQKRFILLSLFYMGLLCCSGFCFSQPRSPSTDPTRAPSHHRSSTSLALASDREMPTTTTTTITDTVSNRNCVQNFRPASGLQNVYRCAKTDGLGDRLDAADDDLSEGERLILYQAGLILDLRSDVERDEKKSRSWMSQAPGGSFVIARDSFIPPAEDLNAPRQRTVLRLDPLSPPEFMKYLEDNWLEPAQKLQAVMLKIVSGQQLHNLRIEVLNQKGLVGLNEAILETGKQDMLAALQAMTLHLEKNPTDPVVIHCVQGKDRTGLLVMLCQSMLGVSDEEIIADYHRSDAMKEGSAALKKALSKQQAGKIDKRIFGGAPKEVMQTTLAWIRSKYGSVSPGYLDDIGFDSSWRDRLSVALRPSQPISRL